MKIRTSIFACMVLGSIVFSTSALAQAADPQLTDPEIASIAVTANQMDIDFAKIAEEKSENEQVLQFARTMASDHQNVINRAVELVTKLNVTPEDNAVSQQLAADAAKTAERLRGLSGEEFNEEYVANEVAYHKKVIGAVEQLLIPQAQNEELKGLLEEVLPVLKGHLEHAEMVEKNL